MFPIGKRIAVLGGKAWTPKNIAGLALWMQADDLSGADGSAVASWISKEGNAYNFAQATGDKQPLLKTGANGINGHKVVLFDGNDDLLVLPSAPLTSTAGSVFLVGKLTPALKNSQNVLCSADEATVAAKVMIFGAYKTGALPQMEMYQHNATGTSDSLRASTSVLVSTTYLWVWRSNGTAYTMRINGNDETLTVVTGANNGDWFGDCSDLDNVSIGGDKWNAEANFYRGSVAELIVYNTNLTGADLTQVENYLTKRYF